MAFVTIISLVLAFFAYFKPRKRQRLLYQTAAIQYFEAENYTLPSDAVMTFEGKRVERLTKAMIILWNGGIDVLRGEDIVQHDPIRITLRTSGRILSFSIVGGTNETNRVLAEVQPQTLDQVFIGYDYLNSQDGVVIQVLHDAKQRHPIVEGAAKGLSYGPRGLGTVDLHALENPQSGRFFRIQMRVFCALGLILLVLGLLRAVDLTIGVEGWLSIVAIWPFTKDRTFSGLFPIFFMGLMFMLMCLVNYFGDRPRYPRSLGAFLRFQDGDSSSTEPKSSWLIWSRRRRSQS